MIVPIIIGLIAGFVLCAIAITGFFESVVLFIAIPIIVGLFFEDRQVIFVVFCSEMVGVLLALLLAYLTIKRSPQC